MTPAPTWVKAAEQPDAYDSVDYFIRTILAPTGAHVRLLVSGDLHHYARYTGAGPGADHLRRRRRVPAGHAHPARDDRRCRRRRR